MKLSELARLPSFALLAPGFTGRDWTLVRPLATGGTTRVFVTPYESDARETLDFSGETEPVELEFDVAPAVVRPSFDENAFASGVRTIREAIAAGDVYQVNLTTRVFLGNVAPEALLALFCRRTVPRFAAWVRDPGFEFVSASPELLFEVDRRRVRTEPMKGTAPAGERKALENSEKDDAELAMITDLVRNDLTRVCEPKSVVVENERRFIELPYAVQAVSDVAGRLPEGSGWREVLAALHPGGSITGAPKEAARAMISSLEDSPRGAYCGVLGFTHGESTIASLLIRTAFRTDEGFTYGVGGGITWDSETDAELAEVRTKLGALR